MAWRMDENIEEVVLPSKRTCSNGTEALAACPVCHPTMMPISQCLTAASAELCHRCWQASVTEQPWSESDAMTT